MNAGARGLDLTVVGFVYFEVGLPGAHVEAASGVEVFVDDIRIGLGGALNTASVAMALGKRVALVHPSGDGLTDAAVRHALGRLGIESVPFAAGPDPAISLVSSGGAERAFVSAADFDAVQRCPALPTRGWIHVPGLREAHRLEPRLREAKHAGAKISVAGSWAPRELDALSTVEGQPWDLLVLNRMEADRAAGRADDAPSRLARAARDVVVTAGASGAFGVVRGEAVRADAVHARVVDSTGAGDAFCAGLLGALASAWTPAESVAFATRVAARQLEVRGGVAGDPTRYADLREEL